ncbi:MAG: glycerol-3-phosphate dehydrogenase [Maritimibacter sp.]|nr:glycerol-3-phosphate dehydrogenase [Maritimibacter sp.]
MQNRSQSAIHDLFVIGGGINGCGIARDAAGRGLDVVLAEKDDLAGATSSASTKLFHGGLRYLEFFEFRLVREALAEREVLLKAMPHISWPMRFVLPYHDGMRFESETPTSKLLKLVMPWMNGRRPAWLIRAGLFLYDHLGERHMLPKTVRVDLTAGPEGAPLADKYRFGYEYSDCWVEDSRLVALNARDAAERGARIMPRTLVVSARREGDLWTIETRRTTDGARKTWQARALVNAGGPWVGRIIEDVLPKGSRDRVRLVRGSHIVTRRLFDHDKAYFFQGQDGRIVFAIPYEQDFTLIGTTDKDHANADETPVCTPEEQDYLIDFVNDYFARRISRDDIVWTYSGVRPLYDDGATSATAATRDYVLKVDATGGAPVLNVFGGKITTYRRLAESAMDKLAPFFTALPGAWTAGVALPGGDFAVADTPLLAVRLKEDFPFLSETWAARLIRGYGRDAWALLGDAGSGDDLAPSFGATLTGAEVIWLMRHEFACSADDIVWRRTKLGLRMSAAEIAALDDWMKNAPAAIRANMDAA